MLEGSTGNFSATRNVYDWYQTNTHVIINIMIKNLKEADVKVKLIDETLDVTCDLADGSIFKLHFNLFKPIYVQDSNWSVTPSKLEIQLKKTDRKRWQSLELIPEKTKQRNSHSNPSHHHHHNHHHNQQHHHHSQQSTQSTPKHQPQLQLQTQIEPIPQLETEDKQSLQQQTDQQSEPKINNPDDPEAQSKSEPEVQSNPELQSESTVEPESELHSQDQTQLQSPPQSHQQPQPQQQQNQQVVPQQQIQQFSFTKSSPEELEFLSNSVELGSTLIELDYVLSV
ncbi:protein hunchback-like isoform X2 [Panonychus citri]|uniref:protein hunchback-like isoform X2 n=1 Tax=Panonychus citri TaxID=50023 RepID=UPI002307F4E6|nr:protein hunchback-like isoform X2 [Panonychus citri]